MASLHIYIYIRICVSVLQQNFQAIFSYKRLNVVYIRATSIGFAAVKKLLGLLEIGRKLRCDLLFEALLECMYV